jgi:hypothetical protein
VQIQVLDRDSLDAPRLGTLLASTLWHLWPDTFAIDSIDGMVGSRQTLRELRDGIAPATVATHWQARLDEFRALREHVLLY